MPDPELEVEFRAARDRFRDASDALVSLLVRMACEAVADVLPGARRLEIEGRINEDWIPTLRIQQVLDESGNVTYDVGFGHADRQVEDTVDEVNTEYLDLLLDLTGDTYMGRRTIERPGVA